MPDYFSYEYDRLVDGVIRLDNPDRVIETPNENAAAIAAVTDENARALFEKLFPPTTRGVILHEEIKEDEILGPIAFDFSASGQVATVRFTRELTPEEITRLDAIVEAHKLNS